MNKLLKKIFLTVALLAACGSALAADLAVTNVTLEGAGIKVYIAGISSTYSNSVGDWTWVKSSGTIDVASGTPQDIAANSYVYVTLASAPTASTGVNEYILTETITGDNIKISLNGTAISYSSAGGGGGGGVDISVRSRTKNSITLDWTSDIANPTSVTLRYNDQSVDLVKTLTSFTVMGLTPGTSYAFTLEVSDGTSDASGSVTVSTVDETACFVLSDEKETDDESLRSGCDFTVPYEFEIFTSSAAPEVTINYKHTQPQAVDNDQVYLERKTAEGGSLDQLARRFSSVGDGWWSITVNSTDMGTSSGNIYFCVKAVVTNTPTSCGANSYYATKKLKYAIGTGCPTTASNVYWFRRRSVDYKFITLQSNIMINKFEFWKESDEVNGVPPVDKITAVEIVPAADTFTYNISDLEPGNHKYKFRIYDVYNTTSTPKIIHGVY